MTIDDRIEKVTERHEALTLKTAVKSEASAGSS
jgi:hypothetical protein